MTVTLRQAIIKRSQLQNKYFKGGTSLNELLYKKQRNHCSNFIEKKRENTATI